MSLSLLTVIATAMVAVLVVLGIRSSAAHRRKIRAHKGMSRSEFAARYVSSGIDPEISGAVYDHFQLLGGVDGFEPYPSDTFAGTYFFCDEEDICDELLEVVQKLGSDKQPIASEGFGTDWPGPLSTVDDAVRWVDRVLKLEREDGPLDWHGRSEPLGLSDDTFRLP